MNYYFYVLKNYAKFDGRARRAEYWYFVLFNFIVSTILQFIDFAIFGLENEISPIQTVYTLAVIVPSIAVAVRRMHDVGKSGWYILIPIYNFILAVTEGDSGPNEYGEDPKNQPKENLDLLDQF